MKELYLVLIAITLWCCGAKNSNDNKVWNEHPLLVLTIEDIELKAQKTQFLTVFCIMDDSHMNPPQIKLHNDSLLILNNAKTQSTKLPLNKEKSNYPQM